MPPFDAPRPSPTAPAPAVPLEDYALLGDCESAALVARNGSIDWLCWPRFDSGACFAALLGTPEHGRWRLGATDPAARVRRRYRPGTLVLETDIETDGGLVTVLDAMLLRTGAADPTRPSAPALVRTVLGRRGSVTLRTELVLRFDYGLTVPWVRRLADGRLRAIAGPDAVTLQSDVPLHGEGLTTVADFTVCAGERASFVLRHAPSHAPPAPWLSDPPGAIEGTAAAWRAWSAASRYQGPWGEAVERSLVVLKALTYRPTGGIVAAPTTSLPEQLGGPRNWDYRYCWLRDATLTLLTLMDAGYYDEAATWRDWLLRACAGSAGQAQIMYGVAGERRLWEVELPWLPGYAASRPVRVGNGAHAQRQLDVYGEVMDALYHARAGGLPENDDAWRLQCGLVQHLERLWTEPDEGIWEVRGPARHFTHSKVMAWVALDRAVRTVERFGVAGPIERWRATRDRIHASVCRDGWDPTLGSFTQAYGHPHLDASLLMIPLVGFLPADDPRVLGTVRAVEERLLDPDGFVRRYDPAAAGDGLPGGEGAFLACSFWLADNYVLQGRRDDACRLFERLLALRTDLGLLAEEWDAAHGRLVGNFPQAFSHVALVDTAMNLARAEAGMATPQPARQRGGT